MWTKKPNERKLVIIYRDSQNEAAYKFKDDDVKLDTYITAKYTVYRKGGHCDAAGHRQCLENTIWTKKKMKN